MEQFGVLCLKLYCRKAGQSQMNLKVIKADLHGCFITGKQYNYLCCFSLISLTMNIDGLPVISRGGTATYLAQALSVCVCLFI